MQNQSISAGLKASIALEKHGFRTSHSLGQNFILDDDFLNLLLDLAGVDEDDCVLEIGPGPGVMTALIARRVSKILSIEMDEKLRPVLESVLEDANNAEIVFCDAMKANIGKLVCDHLGEKYRVIANLPYYITADLIQKMVLCRPMPESICIMVQKEAAERLMSHPGDKNWCALAATVRLYGDCEVLEDVPPSRFNPPPHVDSCFIRIDLHPQTLIVGELESEMLRMIKCCFHMRRKTLANNLKAFYSLDAQTALSILQNAGLSAQVRGESLTLTEIARLTEAFIASKRA